MTELPDWPRAFGSDRPAARIRLRPEDFRVVECLPFQASGDGEFVLLQVEKRQLNTLEAAKRLAQHANVDRAAVSYAGMKDRHAVTRQHFSVHLIKRPEPDWSLLNTSELVVLSSQRHHRKLRIGALAGNQFEIVLRDCDGSLSEQVIEQIAAVGLPNYYGPQRFGRAGTNLQAAAKWLINPRRRIRRDQRSRWLSVARSFLFNEYLALRVDRGDWQQLLQGDVMMLDGSDSVFPSTADERLADRLKSGDLHIAGRLWGKGTSLAVAEALALENQVAAEHELWVDGLHRFGVAAAHRALRVIPKAFSVTAIDHGTWRLSFELPAGSFATAVLRELVWAEGV